MATEPQTAQAHKPGKVAIFIDGVKYHTQAHELTGTQIRALAQPPIGEDRDLWLDIVDELDEPISDVQVVELVDKMRFFAVPRVINPGQSGSACRRRTSDR